MTFIARRRQVDAGVLCDARERDLEGLEIREGAVLLTMPGAIATVRLLLGPAAAMEE